MSNLIEIEYPEEKCKTCIHKSQLIKFKNKFEPESHPCTCCQCMYHEVDHYEEEGGV